MFAPSEAAFVALGSNFDFLVNTAEGRVELARILEYHVLDTMLFSTDLKDGLIARTIEGGTVEFSTDFAGALFINGARIEGKDFLATNGVVHIIDRKFWFFVLNVCIFQEVF